MVLRCGNVDLRIMVSAWRTRLRIKDDLCSGKYYSENIWIMEDVVDKHSVVF